MDKVLVLIFSSTKFGNIMSLYSYPIFDYFKGSHDSKFHWSFVSKFNYLIEYIHFYEIEPYCFRSQLRRCVMRTTSEPERKPCVVNTSYVSSDWHISCSYEYGTQFSEATVSFHTQPKQWAEIFSFILFYLVFLLPWHWQQWITIPES